MIFSKVNVVYGSQTGTAYDVALWVSKRLSTVISSVSCLSGDDLVQNSWPLTPEHTYIFIVATAGNGDFPINFRRLIDKLFSSESSLGNLNGVRFAVFGLGDSKYSQYNFASRLLFGRLRSLSGVPICNLGCGDDQNILGYSQELIPWFSEVWSAITGKEWVNGAIDLSLALTTYAVSASTVSEPLTSPVSAHSIGLARVLSNHRITSADHFQDVRLVSLQVFQTWEFQPGDVVAVLPRVSRVQAEAFVRDVLRRGPCEKVYIERRNCPGTLSSSLLPIGEYTFGQLFSDFLDITSCPTHFFYEVLFGCFRRQLERDTRVRSATEEETLVFEKLQLLAAFTFEGASERLRYSFREKLSIQEVLWDFRIVSDIPLEALLECVPRIAKRYYSLCSAVKEANFFSKKFCVPKFKVHATKVQLLVAVTDYTTLFGRRRKGLASSFLTHELIVGEASTRIALERGFTSQKNLKALQRAENLIMFGPGTGVAPCMALLESLGGMTGERNVLLITGFRNPRRDFLAKKFLNSVCPLSGVHALIAWSRPDNMERDLGYAWSKFDCSTSTEEAISRVNSIVEKDAVSGRKTWVQDMVAVEKEKVVSLLENPNCVILIGGRSHPTPDQILTEIECLVGQKRVKSMVQQGKVVFDTWG